MKRMFGTWFLAVAIAGGAHGRVASQPPQSSPFGSPTVFNPAMSVRPTGARLTATSFVTIYADSGNGGYGTGAIATVSGQSVGFGSESVFNPAATSYPMVTSLGSGTFVTTYSDTGNNSFGTAVVGTVSGTNIAYGSEVVFNNAYSPYQSVRALGSDKCVVVYRDDGNGYAGTAIVGSVSGTSISFGSEYVFETADCYYIFAAVLDANRFVVAYRQSTTQAIVVIGTVSGSTVTFGPKSVFNSGNTEQISVDALGANSFIVGYVDTADGLAGHAVVGTVSGSTISLGSELAFNTGTTNYASVAALDSTHAAIAYRDDSNGGFGTSTIATISGTTASFGSPMVFHSASTNNPWVIALSANSWIVLYLDTNNGMYGTGVVYAPVSGGGDDDDGSDDTPQQQAGSGGSDDGSRGSCGGSVIPAWNSSGLLWILVSALFVLVGAGAARRFPRFRRAA